MFESSVDQLQMLHPSGTSRMSAVCFLAPTVYSLFLAWVGTRSTSALLYVVGATSTSPAQSMRLVVTLTKTCGTLCHGNGTSKLNSKKAYWVSKKITSNK